MRSFMSHTPKKCPPYQTILFFKDEECFIIDRGWTVASRRRWNHLARRVCLRGYLQIQDPTRSIVSSYPLRRVIANSNRIPPRSDMDSAGRSMHAVYLRFACRRKKGFAEHDSVPLRIEGRCRRPAARCGTTDHHLRAYSGGSRE